jgi:flavin reductase (DIM6/NTAB) family NADH-FMN oxidoreductase RutF
MSWIDERPDDAMAGAFFEAHGPAAIVTVEPKLFREAMSRLGAAVHIVATDGSAGKAAFTATAVASVSDAPPTLLVCLNQRSQCTPVFKGNGAFCVSTLRAGGEEIADLFAGRSGVAMAERFKTGRWEPIKTGAPALASAVVAFDCRVVEARAVATHNIFFGAVEAVRLGAPGPALVYHEREYKQV